MYICPKCKLPLERNRNTLLCQSNHCYDVASQGYVNLILGSKNTSKHGDNKEMIIARRAFLGLGHYKPIITELSKLITKHTVSDKIRILDAGCGEGYYTSGVSGSLTKPHEIYGIDVSKEAVVKAAATYKNANFAVASVNALPFSNSSFDATLSLFAPLAEDEFSRVLKKDGVLITVSPSPKHLFGMKEKIYDTPYENPPSTFTPNLFDKINEYTISSEITLDNQSDIFNLFNMTPYCYNTGKIGIERIKAVKSLTTEIGFVFGIYKKK